MQNILIEFCRVTESKPIGGRSGHLVHGFFLFQPASTKSSFLISAVDAKAINQFIAGAGGFSSP